jgi:hypothetical protein
MSCTDIIGIANDVPLSEVAGPGLFGLYRISPLVTMRNNNRTGSVAVSSQKGNALKQAKKPQFRVGCGASDRQQSPAFGIGLQLA